MYEHNYEISSTVHLRKRENLWLKQINYKTGKTNPNSRSNLDLLSLNSLN